MAVEDSGSDALSGNGMALRQYYTPRKNAINTRRERHSTINSPGFTDA
jgi:hypothetical protein